MKGISPEADSFRFHSPSERLGEGWAVQYHAGVDYRFLCLKNLHSLIFSGIYFDHSRSAQNSRVHLTWGLEFNPWFVRLNAGIDMAPGYRNVAFGVGVDIADILRMLKVFPPEVQAPAGGAFPSPLEISDDWLPTQLQDNPDDAFQTIGPGLEDIPKTLEKIPEALK